MTEKRQIRVRRPQFTDQGEQAIVEYDLEQRWVVTQRRIIVGSDVQELGPMLSGEFSKLTDAVEMFSNCREYQYEVLDELGDIIVGWL